MGATRRRVGVIVAPWIVALCATSAAPAFGAADLYVGIEPYGFGAQTHTYGVEDGKQRELAGFVASHDNAAAGLKVQLEVPPGVALESATPAKGTFDAATGIWDVGTLDTSGLVGITLRVSRTLPGDHEMVMRVVASDEPDPATEDNTFTAVIHEPLTRWVAPGAPASGDCLTIAAACDLHYAATDDGPTVDGDIVRVLPGDYLVTEPLGLVRGASLVGDDATNKPRLVNTRLETFVAVHGDRSLVDLELVDTTSSPTGAAVLVTGEPFGAAQVQRVVIHSTRTAIATGANVDIRDAIVVGGSPSLGAVRALRSGVRLENATVINTSTGPAIAAPGDGTQIANTIARSAGGTDLVDVASATRSNFDTSLRSPAPGSGDNQTTPPSFVDVAKGDYHQAAGSVTIDAGAPSSSTHDVDGGLRALGQVDIGGDERGPVARLTPRHHDFGDVIVGHSRFASFTLTNVGTAPLAVGSLGSDSAEFTQTSGSTCSAGQLLSPGASCSYEAQFKPTSAGSKSATLFVRVNKQTNPATALVSAMATGQPGITLTGDGAFGDVVVGSSAIRTFTVTSTGSLSLSVGTPTITGPGAQQYAISRNTCSSPVTPTGTCEIDVTFAPTSLGPTSATLNVPTDAPGETPTVALSGNGSSVPVATTLTAAPATFAAGPFAVRLVARATLRVSSTNAPLGGRTIVFTVGGAPLCSAVTSSTGTASCSGLGTALAIVLNRGYDAHFAGALVGSTNYLPSSAHGALLGLP